MEIVHSDKHLLGEPRIKKDNISIAQLQQYLVNMVDAGNRDNAKADQSSSLKLRCSSGATAVILS